MRDSGWGSVILDRGSGIEDSRMRLQSMVCTALVFSASLAFAQQPARQTEQDEYTKYELLDPASASFAIDYEVTATTAGATLFFNPIRKGSVASNESVYDMMTGQRLKFEQVS